MRVLSSRKRVLVDPDAHSYRWWLLFVTSIGALLASLASGTQMSPSVLVAVFSDTQSGSQGIDLQPVIGALHLAFGAGVVVSVIGAVLSLLRGGHRSWEPDALPGPDARPGASAAA